MGDHVHGTNKQEAIKHIIKTERIIEQLLHCLASANEQKQNPRLCILMSLLYRGWMAEPHPVVSLVLYRLKHATRQSCSTLVAVGRITSAAQIIVQGLEVSSFES